MVYESESYYKFSAFVTDWIATAGVMNFCEENACYWILDVIESYTPQLKEADYLKIIEVVVDTEKSSCVFTIRDEIKGELIRQEIPFTDLTENVVIWGITEADRTVLLLPSEY
jgi:hypothetical protein